MFVKKLRTNLKNLGEVDLAPCTLVIGPNMAGKTSVVDATLLALNGEVRSEDIGKRELDLMALAPPGENELRVEAVLSDDREVHWSTTGSTRSAKRAIREIHTNTNKGNHEIVKLDRNLATILMDEAVSDMLRGDPKRIAAEVLSRMDAPIMIENLSRLVPAALEAEIVAYLPQMAEKDPIIRPSDLEAATKSVTSQATVVGKRRTALEEQANKFHEPLDEEELQELEGLVRTLEQVPAHNAAPENAKDKLSQLQAESRELTQRIASLKPPQDAAQHNRRRTMVQACLGALTTQSAIMRELGTAQAKCLLCQGTVSLGFTDQRISAVQEAIRELDQTIASQHERNILVERAKHDLDKVTGDIKRLGGLLDGPAVNLEAVALQRKRVQELQARAAGAEQSAAATRGLAAAQRESDNLSELKRILASVTDAELTARIVNLENRIEAGLAGREKVKIKLRDGSKRVFRLTVQANGVERDFRTMSGAERLRILAAFASALLQKAAPPVRLIIVDEVALDGAMLRKVLKGIGNLVASEGGPTQAIVTAVAWKGKVPDGWVEVRVPIE